MTTAPALQAAAIRPNGAAVAQSSASATPRSRGSTPMNTGAHRTIGAPVLVRLSRSARLSRDVGVVAQGCGTTQAYTKGHAALSMIELNGYLRCDKHG